MSESSEKSSEQEQELRRRNINSGSGDYEQNNEEESSKIGDAHAMGRKFSADNDTMDSDHVRINAQTW